MIIGTKKRSIGQWFRNGKPIDFDYMEEKVVARGNTWDELWESARKYHKLSQMSWEEVFEAGGIDKITA